MGIGAHLRTADCAAMGETIIYQVQQRGMRESKSQRHTEQTKTHRETETEIETETDRDGETDRQRDRNSYDVIMMYSFVARSLSCR